MVDFSSTATSRGSNTAKYQFVSTPGTWTSWCHSRPWAFESMFICSIERSICNSDSSLSFSVKEYLSEIFVILRRTPGNLKQNSCVSTRDFQKNMYESSHIASPEVLDELQVHNQCTHCTGVSQDPGMLLSLVVSLEQQIVWETSCKYSKSSAYVSGRLPGGRRGGCIWENLNIGQVCFLGLFYFQLSGNWLAL